MKSEHYQRVEKFMELAGQDRPENAGLPSKEILKLRAALILEEALETINALGFSVHSKYDGTNVPSEYNFDSANGFFYTMDPSEFHLVGDLEPDLVEIADGCADVLVVTTGTMIACGFDDVELMAAVDQNNLDKFGPGHSRREDGKLVKPPGHKPPDIEAILKLNGLDS
jgi:predicted HAD superfamily Cof-like phosphohydrolase